MTEKSNESILAEVKNNFSISYKLLRDNWKPFAKTELFATVCMAIIVIFALIISLTLKWLRVNVPIISFGLHLFNSFRLRIFTTKDFHLFLYFFVIVIFNLFFLTFLTSQFGLANDIFNSGHMYAEFNSSFSYYRKHWFSYTLITIAIYWVKFLADPLSILPVASLYEKSKLIPIALTSIKNFLAEANFFVVFSRQLAQGLFQLFMIVLLIGILPSVTQNNKLWDAVKQNFTDIKNNFSLITITWFIYFLIFILPQAIISVILLLFMNNYFSYSSIIFLGLAHIIIDIIFLFISTPIMSLLATRTYISLRNDKKIESTHE